MSQGSKSAARRIRDRLPMKGRKFAARAGNFFGAEYAFPSTTATLASLANRGYNPQFVVDVGAYIGLWTSDFREIFPESRVVMVEPQADKAPILSALVDDRTRFSATLVGAADNQSVEFYEMETGSSVMSELTNVDRTVVHKTLTTLDTLLATTAGGWGSPDFLKLDVQGYELEVLNGAASTLAGCEFVLLEAAITPYNEGAPLLPEVMAYMTSRGFRLFDLCSQMRRSDGSLLQSDVLFVKDTSRFVPQPAL